MNATFSARLVAATRRFVQRRLAPALIVIVLALSVTAVSAVPIAPTNLRADPGSPTNVLLFWQDNAPDDTAVEIERSTDGSTFMSIATVSVFSGINAISSAQDRTGNPATLYYYRVRALNASGPSAYSNIASATTASVAPSSPAWVSTDVGQVAAAGQSSVANGVLTITGSGNDIWDRSDEFHYRWIDQWDGDIVMTARVTGLTNTHGWAKAGFMIRGLTAPNYPHVFMCLSSSHGTALQYRLAQGDLTETAPPSEDGPAPRWLRLVRVGTTFTGFDSFDGVNWRQRGSVTSFGGGSVIGFAVTSHDDGVLCTATFDNISIQRPAGPPSPLAAPSNLIATPHSASYVGLQWTDNSSDESSFVVERSTDNVTFTAIAYTNANIAYYTDGPVSGATTYYYRVGALRDASSAFSTVVTVTTPGDPPGTLGAPTNLVTNSFVPSHINLTWTDNSTNEAGFSIERSSDGTQFAVLGTVGANARTYSDTAMTGTPTPITYTYRVRAFAGSTFSAYSNLATATYPAGGPGFEARDIGGASPAGTGTWENASTYAVRAGGVDIWEGSDSFTFASEPWTGDGEFVALVTRLDHTNAWAKAGLMFRALLEPGARNAFMLVTAGHGLGFQSRSAAGGPTSLTLGRHGGPTWLKITRQGDVFRGFESIDGTNWTPVGSVTLALPQSIHVGMAVTSHQNGTSTFARFENIYIGQVRGAQTSPPAAPSDFVVTALSQTEIDLRWRDNANNEAGFELDRSTDNVTFTRIYSPGPNVVGYIDRSLSENTTYYYRIRAVNPAGNSSYVTASARTFNSTSLPPAAPSNLTAEINEAWQITLRWTDNSTTETGFEVERGTDGATFTRVATTPASAIRYDDTGLSPSTRYYYRVRAVQGSAVSTYSNIASGTTPSSPPLNPGFTGIDIGSVAATGSHAISTQSGYNGSVSGSGADIWDNSDEFYFAYQRWQGDGRFYARVSSMTNTHAWAKAGIMIRESLAPNSRHVFIAVTPNALTALYTRTTTGGSTSLTTGGDWLPNPAFRLERTGNTFTAFQSADGNTWTPIGSPVTLDFPTEYYWGLAVTSHVDGTLCTAQFSGIHFSGGSGPQLPPPPPPTWSQVDVGAVGVAGSNTASGNTITIRGSGADIWENADGFRFVYRTLSGDCTVEAQITSLDNTHPWAKAGVMIRESLEPGARNVFALVTPANGVFAQARTTASGSTQLMSGPWGAGIPYWVRLVRSGNTLTASTSPNGVSWTPLATYPLAFSGPAYVGFATTSHDNSTLTTAVFTDPFVE